MGERLRIDFFDPTRTEEEAKRAQKLEQIYHIGQDKIWEGRTVLAELIERHGLEHIHGPKKQAIMRVFSGLMWGELAAWKISAQLADRLTDFSAKMAATSQVHDEARHFFVLHAYLEAINGGPEPIERLTRGLLDTVIGAERMFEKIAGMQLFIESIALTMFKAVREANVCPILTHLLQLFERDEARHVGLGVQYLPLLMKDANRLDRVRLNVFQLRILSWALASLKKNHAHLKVLGIDPRAVAALGRKRMLDTQDLLSEESGRRFDEIAGPVVMRLFDTVSEFALPESELPSLRLKAIAKALLGQPALAH